MRLWETAGLVCAIALCGINPAAAADDDGKKPQNFLYLKPLMFPVVANGGIDQFVSITVTLEFEDPANEGKAQAIEPRIVDAYLQDLYGAVARDKVIRNGVLDPIALKTELESSNSRILPGMTCRVLLDNIGQRAVHSSPL